MIRQSERIKKDINKILPDLGIRKDELNISSKKELEAIRFLIYNYFKTKHHKKRNENFHDLFFRISKELKLRQQHTSSFTTNKKKITLTHKLGPKNLLKKKRKNKDKITENKNKECTFFSIPTFLNDCSFSQTVENSQEQNIQVMDEETRLFCKNFGPIKFDDSYFDLGNTYVSNFTARERQIKKIMRNFEIQPPVITNSIDISFLDQDNTYEMIDDKYFCK